MTPPSITIFLALSGLILVAGVLYWFWSHLQLTQKKVQLLENAVFELRGMLASSGGGSAGPPVAAATVVEGAAAPVAAPAAAYNDLADDGWEEDGAAAAMEAEEVIQKSTPLDLPPEAPVQQISREVELNIDELAPGGRIQIGEEKASATEAGTDEFRELFISGSGEVAPATSGRGSGGGSGGETLEGMPVRDLRRLAEQRGIRGVADMKKKELLAALRQQVVATTAPATTAVELSVVREETVATAADDAEILE